MANGRSPIGSPLASPNARSDQFIELRKCPAAVHQLRQLHDELRAALIRMEQEHAVAVKAAAAGDRVHSLVSLQSRLGAAAQRRLIECESDGGVNGVGDGGSTTQAALERIVTRRWKARIREVLEDAELLVEDTECIKRLQTVSSSADDVKHRAAVLSDMVQIQDPESRIVPVSRDFIADLVVRCDLLTRENRHLSVAQEKLKRVLAEAKEQRRQLKNLATRLKQEREEASVEIDRLSICLQNLAVDASPSSESLTSEIVARDVRSQQLRQALRDRRGRIRVFLRVRPDESNFLEIVGRVKVVLRTASLAEFSASAAFFNSKAFYFDRVFDQSSSTPAVFSAMHELVASCCLGVNVCIMAYGQTGSGKTFTMVGNPGCPGVSRLAIAQLLRSCRSQEGMQYSCSMSAVEIYKEEIRDLLRSKAPNYQQQQLKLVTNESGDSVLHGLTEVSVQSESQVDAYVATAEGARIYAATNLNERSSRSHVILLLRLRGYDRNGVALHSSLTLCDLAGSEGAEKSGVSGAGLREASAINRSLLSLGKVFEDLRRRQRPCFRESKLTRLLQPQLTGRSRCLVIVTVRQSVHFVDETVRSLIFGQSVMQNEQRCDQQRNEETKEVAEVEDDADFVEDDASLCH